MTTRLDTHGEDRALAATYAAMYATTDATTTASYAEPGGALVMGGLLPELCALTNEAGRRHATPTPDPDPDPRDVSVRPPHALRSSEPVCLVDRRPQSATRG
jgi:hypothetical protein